MPHILHIGTQDLINIVYIVFVIFCGDAGLIDKNLDISISASIKVF